MTGAKSCSCRSVWEVLTLNTNWQTCMLLSRRCTFHTLLCSSKSTHFLPLILLLFPYWLSCLPRKLIVLLQLANDWWFNLIEVNGKLFIRLIYEVKTDEEVQHFEALGLLWENFRIPLSRGGQDAVFHRLSDQLGGVCCNLRFELPPTDSVLCREPSHFLQTLLRRLLSGWTLKWPGWRRTGVNLQCKSGATWGQSASLLRRSRILGSQRWVLRLRGARLRHMEVVQARVEQERDQWTACWIRHGGPHKELLCLCRRICRAVTSGKAPYQRPGCQEWP